jgi:hypothetical protein
VERIEQLLGFLIFGTSEEQPLIELVLLPLERPALQALLVRCLRKVIPLRKDREVNEPPKYGNRRDPTRAVSRFTDE